MSHNISQISSQVIQVLHHLQPQLQIEIPLTTTSIITKMANETNLVKDSLKHEDRSMPRLILHEGEDVACVRQDKYIPYMNKTFILH